MMLPTLGSDKLAVPVGGRPPASDRAFYTAIDFNPGDRRITFDVMDLGKPGWWLNRTGVGSPVGVIGFKHELVLVPGVTDVVAVGDRSARPAVGSLTNLAEQVRIHSFTGPSCEHGFPDIEWVDIVDRTKAQTESTMLWIGGEKSCVAPLAQPSDRKRPTAVPDCRIAVLVGGANARRVRSCSVPAVPTRSCGRNRHFRSGRCRRHRTAVTHAPSHGIGRLTSTRTPAMARWWCDFNSSDRNRKRCTRTAATSRSLCSATMRRRPSRTSSASPTARRSTPPQTPPAPRPARSTTVPSSTASSTAS